MRRGWGRLPDTNDNKCFCYIRAMANRFFHPNLATPTATSSHHRVAPSFSFWRRLGNFVVRDGGRGDEAKFFFLQSRKVRDRHFSFPPSSYSSNDKKEVANFFSSSSFRLDKWPPDCTALFCVLQLLLLLLFFLLPGNCYPSILPPSLFLFPVLPLFARRQIPSLSAGDRRVNFPKGKKSKKTFFPSSDA